MVKIEHLGIAVKSLEKSIPTYEKLLQTKCYKTEKVDAQKVITAFLTIGESKIELLEGTETDSVISKFIEKKGEGIHHIALEVEDISSEMNRLRSEGFHLLNEVPQHGADNKLICFIHPKDTSGVLIELCQDIKETL